MLNSLLLVFFYYRLSDDKNVYKIIENKIESSLVLKIQIDVMLLCLIMSFFC